MPDDDEEPVEDAEEADIQFDPRVPAGYREVHIRLLADLYNRVVEQNDILEDIRDAVREE